MADQVIEEVKGEVSYAEHIARKLATRVEKKDAKLAKLLIKTADAAKETVDYVNSRQDHHA